MSLNAPFVLIAVKQFGEHLRSRMEKIVALIVRRKNNLFYRKEVHLRSVNGITQQCAQLQWGRRVAKVVSYRKIPCRTIYLNILLYHHSIWDGLRIRYGWCRRPKAIRFAISDLRQIVNCGVPNQIKKNIFPEVHNWFL